MTRRLTDDQFAKILDFRVALRRFGRWSEEQAAEVGLTAGQYQLLIAVRGHRDSRGPTIREVADHLLVRHHSAVGLVDRTEQLDLIERRRDEADHRLVRLRLTPQGEKCVSQLAAAHLEELQQLALILGALREAGDN